MDIENCYTCENCVKKGKNYSCLHKKCQMGEKPFYPIEVKESDKILKLPGLIIENVCNYIKKEENKKGIDKWLNSV